MTNQPYRVSTAKENGQVSVDVLDDPSAKYHLDLRVENGEISVLPSD